MHLADYKQWIARGPSPPGEHAIGNAVVDYSVDFNSLAHILQLM